MCAKLDVVNNPVGSLEITSGSSWTIQLKEKASYLQSSEYQPCTLALSSKSAHQTDLVFMVAYALQYPFQQCLLASDHNVWVCDSLPRLLL